MKSLLSKYNKETFKDNPSTDYTNAMNVKDDKAMDPALQGQGNSSLGAGIPNENVISGD
jgi:hypothetical protein